MRRLLSCIFIITGYTAVAQNADSAWIVNNYTKKEVYIPMRDGKKLFTAVYIPKDTTEAHPILMERTPYSCAPYGEDTFQNWWSNYYKEYFKEGYIMVKQDVRGRWMSEDEFVNVRPFNPNNWRSERKPIPSAIFIYNSNILRRLQYTGGNNCGNCQRGGCNGCSEIDP